MLKRWGWELRVQAPQEVWSTEGGRVGGVDCTWVEEDDGFEAGVLVVIDLQLLERQHQLVEDAHGHPAHLRQLRAVPRDDVVIPCVVGKERGWGSHLGYTPYP